MSQAQPPLLPAVRRRRSNRVVLALLVVLFGIPLTVFLAWRLSLANDIRALEQKIRDAGEPLTLAELAATRPAVPDEENAAVALIGIWAAERTGDLATPDREPQESKSPWSVLSPQLPVLRSGEHNESEQLPWTEEQRAAADEFLRSIHDRQERIRAALRLPHTRFPGSIPASYGALQPHLGKVRFECAILRLAALDAAGRTNATGAIENACRMVEMADLLRGEHAGIGQSIRITCWQSVTETVEEVISTVQPSATDLGEIAEKIESVRFDHSLYQVLLAERAGILGVFDTPFAALDSASSDGMAEVFPEDPAVGAMTMNQSPMGWVGYVHLDRRHLLETYADMIRMAKPSSWSGLADFEVLVRARAKEASQFPRKLLSSMLLPGLAGAGDKFAGAEARRRCAVVALRVLALARQQTISAEDAWIILKNSSLPQELLIDPFDRSSLKFSAREGGFTIYSVGADRIDHAGNTAFQRGRPAAVDIAFTVRNRE